MTAHTNWSFLSIFISLSSKSKIWIHRIRKSALDRASRTSRCINALHRSAEARKRVSGIPCGSRWKISTFRSSSSKGKITRLKISSTCAWVTSSNKTWGPNRIRCSWAMALWRTSRAAFADWREREMSRGKHNWRQAGLYHIRKIQLRRVLARYLGLSQD